MSERDEIMATVYGALPPDWFTSLRVRIDREEILIVGTLADRDEPASRRVKRFRAETKADRIAIARDLERRHDRKVSWGVIVDDAEVLFTTVSVPTMTRLRQQERAVLDTLIDAGVARSRSDALAWCVRLVGANEQRWLSELRDAFATVEHIRDAGPDNG